MKKILLAAFCIVSITGFSQVRIGVEAGYNTSGFSITGSNQQYYSLSNISTFHAGMVTERKLSDYFYFSSGLLFVEKGGIKNKTDFAITGSNTTTKINYLQVPVDLTFKRFLTTNMQLVLSGGLYGAYGISGTQKGTDVSQSSTVQINNTVHFTNSSSYYATDKTPVRPFDLGYQFSAGIEYKSVQLKLNYSKGFTNIYPSGTSQFYNHVAGISVAYLFSK